MQIRVFIERFKHAACIISFHYASLRRVNSENNLEKNFVGYELFVSLYPSFWHSPLKLASAKVSHITIPRITCNYPKTNSWNLRMTGHVSLSNRIIQTNISITERFIFAWSTQLFHRRQLRVWENRKASIKFQFETIGEQRRSKWRRSLRPMMPSASSNSRGVLVARFHRVYGYAACKS